MAQRLCVLGSVLMVVGLVAGCGSDGTDEATVDTTDTSVVASVTTSAEAPDTSVALVDRRQASPADILLPAESFPDGYTLAPDEEEASDEACSGVESASSAHPAVEELLLMATGAAATDHLLWQGASRYLTAGDAEAAFNYFQQLPALCNAKMASSDVDETAEFVIESIALPLIDGSDRVAGLRLTIIDIDATVVADNSIALVDNWVVQGLSTDGEASVDLVAALVQRARGGEEAPEISTTGQLQILAGYGSAEYWSTPGAGPVAIRETAADPASLVDPDVQAWVTAIGDDQLDSVAANACAQTVNLDGTVAGLEAAIGGVLGADGVPPAAPEVMGGVYGLVVSVYCPGFFSNITAAAGG